MTKKERGWRKESARHALAAKGIKTKYPKANRKRSVIQAAGYGPELDRAEDIDFMVGKDVNVWITRASKGRAKLSFSIWDEDDVYEAFRDSKGFEYEEVLNKTTDKVSERDLREFAARGLKALISKVESKGTDLEQYTVGRMLYELDIAKQIATGKVENEGHGQGFW